MSDQEKRLSNRVNRQASATDDRIEKFILTLNRFLGSNLDDILAKVLEGKKSGIESASILGSLLSELEARGLAAEVAKLRTIYAEELRYISDEFEEQGIKAKDVFSEADRETVNALIDIQTQKALNTVNRLGIDIQSQVMASVVAGITPDVKQIRSDLTPTLENSLRTEISTAVMAFNRTVTLQKAAEIGLDLFLYVGPDDKVTRPFCHRLLERKPPIYTRKEIAAMDNDQGLSVYTYGGGYNCRHHWRAISEEFAKELGYEG